MTREIKLENLDYSQLCELEKKMIEAKRKKEDEEIKKIALQIDEIIETSGLNPKLILSALKVNQRKSKKKETKKVNPKYCHPKDHNLLWSGRGAKPKWLKEFLEQGGTLEETEIDNNVLDLDKN